MGRRSKRSHNGEANAKKRARFESCEEQDNLHEKGAPETTRDEIELGIESDCEFEELEVPDEELAMIQSLNSKMADTAPIDALTILRFSKDADKYLKTGSRPGNSRTSQYRRYTQGKDITGMKSLFEYFKRPDNDNLEAHNLEAVALRKRSPKEMISEILAHLQQPNNQSHEKYQLEVLLRYYQTLIKNGNQKMNASRVISDHTFFRGEYMATIIRTWATL
ncbi:hypothetical protein V1505DRAFT_359224, partial [Lipomyces doorenjongii]